MRKLGKKLMGAVLVAALTATMSFSVLAANNTSANKNGVVSEATSAKDANGNAVKVTFAALTAEQKEAAKEIQTTEGLKAVLGNAFVEGMKVREVVDVQAPEDAVFPLTITFKVAGVTPNSDVAVLHYDEGAKAWEVIKATAGNGTITATFNSLSPVAFVTNAPEASHKTGETATTGVVAIIALVAAAGAYTFRKKAVVR